MDIARPVLPASMCSANGNRSTSTTPARCRERKSTLRSCDGRGHSSATDGEAGAGSGLQHDHRRRKGRGEDRARRSHALLLQRTVQARVREESEEVSRMMRGVRCQLSVVGCLLAASTASAQTTADDIIKRELATSRAYETLEVLTDNIGPRLSGSPNA